MALSYRSFCPCDGRQAGLWYLPAGWRDTTRLIDREALPLNELVFERVQVRVIEPKLQLEGAIRQAAALAQQGNRLIHHRDKVHRVSSLPGLGFRTYGCAHHSIHAWESMAGSPGSGEAAADPPGASDRPWVVNS